jgi:hypothetical protein
VPKFYLGLKRNKTQKKRRRRKKKYPKKADREKEEWKKAADRMVLREKAEKHRLDQRKHVSIVTPEGVEEYLVDDESFLKTMHYI